MKIRHVAWRDGRPRFPGTNLRQLGYVGTDLRWPSHAPPNWKPANLKVGSKQNFGPWFTAEEAAEWSRIFCARLMKDRLPFVDEMAEQQVLNRQAARTEALRRVAQAIDALRPEMADIGKRIDRLERRFDQIEQALAKLDRATD